MKNLIVNIFKTFFFFDLALIISALLPEFKTENPALLILFNEAANFLVVGILTVFFLKFVEKRKLPLSAKKGKFKATLLGIMLGAVIPSLFYAIMRLTKHLSFAGFNKIPQFWIYIIAIFFNAVACEFLIRGYLFRLYKKYYGLIFATITTTLLFITANTEILKMGKKYIAVILLLNIALCFLTDLAKTPAISIFARFIYCGLSGFIFGGKLFSEEYPQIGNYVLDGKKIYTGGKYLIEGSLITLIAVSVLCFALFVIKYRKYFTKQAIKNELDYIKSIPENIKNYTVFTFKKLLKPFRIIRR